MTEETKTQAWWSTLPGILTATAALITAVSGLFLGLHQIGLLGNKSRSSAESAHTIDSTKPSAPADTTATSTSAPSSVALPAISEFKLGGWIYKILAAQIERANTEKLTLRLAVRMTNNDPYPANFWDDSFRLLVDGVPRAPVSGLNKVVNGHSAEEGEVVFAVPTTVKAATLQIRHNDEVTQTPLRLR